MAALIIIENNICVSGWWMITLPAGSRSPPTGRWDLPTWASRTPAATRASPGIDLACRVRLGGSSSPVSCAANERNVCGRTPLSKQNLLARYGLTQRGWSGEEAGYRSVRPPVNNRWAGNINKLLPVEECAKTNTSKLLQGLKIFMLVSWFTTLTVNVQAVGFFFCLFSASV